MLARLLQHAGAPTAAALHKHTHVLFILPQTKQLAGAWPGREVLEACAIGVPDDFFAGAASAFFFATLASTLSAGSVVALPPSCARAMLAGLEAATQAAVKRPSFETSLRTTMALMVHESCRATSAERELNS